MKENDFRDLKTLEGDFWWFKGMREITAALLDPFLPPGNDRTIFDDGCGTGIMLSWLGRYAGNGKVIGIDVSEVALQFCRASVENPIMQASATDLPFSDSSVDVITSFDVLVQLPGSTDDSIAIKEMFRVLKPGGIAFVRVAAYNWMRSGHDKAIDSYKRYTMKSLNKKMEDAGFTVQRTTYVNTILFPLAIIRRLVLKHVGLADQGSDVKPFPSRLRWMNSLFTSILVSEAGILKWSKKNFPAGLSVICIAKKT
jgi:SAM-dependent methyltransferase